jgi:hypothetical protein
VPPATATPAPTPPAGATPTPTPSPGASATPAAPGTFAEWPAGQTAYTVIMWSADTRQEAQTKAQAFQTAGATTLGILHSDDFASLRPGYWVVFSGTYDDLKQAQDAATAAQATAPGAYAKQVKPR